MSVPHDSKSPSLPQYPESYWLASTELPRFPKLEEDIRADVAVVGAGISGITTAYLLARKGLKVAILNAGRILNGTTGSTTAKVTAQHDLIYDEFISHFGVEKARLYYEANMEALRWIRSTAEELKVDCQLAAQDAYVYTQSDDYVEKLQAEYRAYEQLGIPGALVEDTPLPYKVKGAVVMKDQAQFNPVPFLVRLTEELGRMGALIFEDTTVVGVTKEKPCTVKTQGGAKVTCDYAVSASHFPFNDRNGHYYARLHMSRSYVLAVRTVKEFPGGMYITAESPGRSLRSVMVDGKPAVLISGESHKTGQGICTHRHYENLQRFGEDTFGIRDILYRWSAQDLYSLDNMPYIGQELPDVPNLFVATGYRKWGMTNSVVSALLNSKLILGEQSPYEEVFTPRRFVANPSIQTFLRENANVAVELISGKLELTYKHPEDLANDEGSVVRVQGRRAGAYRDGNGQLYVVDTTCTHMGCEVEWNDAERTWDCPCHGSRYSYQGEVIEGPAKKALDKVELR